MTIREFTALTREQQKTIADIHVRKCGGKRQKKNFLDFIEEAYYHNVMGCVMLPWCGMWLGIEEDGHSHS